MSGPSVVQISLAEYESLKKVVEAARGVFGTGRDRKQLTEALDILDAIVPTCPACRDGWGRSQDHECFDPNAAQAADNVENP